MNEANAPSAAPERSALPPPTFEFLVLSLQAQAEIALGMLPVEEAEKPEMDLDLARHTIDLLSMLSNKTQGNLTHEEQRLIENILTELRFRFVQAASRS